VTDFTGNKVEQNSTVAPPGDLTDQKSNPKVNVHRPRLQKENNHDDGYELK
jgi:hypothetical protein